MTCKEFFDVWKIVCKTAESKIIDAWDSGSWKKYTDVILGKSNSSSIIVSLKNELNRNEKDFDFYQEYYSCDVVFFKEDDYLKEDPTLKFHDNEKRNTPSAFSQLWLKKIRIHFEHENDIKTSWHEIMQFCVIPGDLNVLITYPNDETERQNAISCYEDILRNTEFHNEILIVFGSHLKGSKSINWDGYIWEKEKGKLKKI